MKQFILATAIAAVGNSLDLTANKLQIDNKTGADFMHFIVGHGNDLPVDTFTLYKKNLSYTITQPTDGTNFAASFTCEINNDYQYNEVSVVISKKGAVFNERNVWTTSGHGNTLNDIAKMLEKNINMMTNLSGVKATANNSTVSLANPNDPTQDYDIKVILESVGTADNPGAKKEKNITVTTTHGVKPIADAAWVKELAHKCMGDKGIDYTYVDAAIDTYHFYNNEGKDVTAAKYKIFNIRVYNPRYDHRIDEPLYQMIHIAVPSNVGTTLLENALKDVDSSNEQTDSNAPAANA